MKRLREDYCLRPFDATHIVLMFRRPFSHCSSASMHRHSTFDLKHALRMGYAHDDARKRKSGQSEKDWGETNLWKTRMRQASFAGVLTDRVWHNLIWHTTIYYFWLRHQMPLLLWSNLRINNVYSSRNNGNTLTLCRDGDACVLWTVMSRALW